MQLAEGPIVDPDFEVIEDEPKQELPSKCDTCVHWAPVCTCSKDGPCNSHNNYQHYRPKQDKRCGTCKYEDLDDNDEPCDSCRGPNFSEWEPKA